MKLTILTIALLASAVSCFHDSRVTENVWMSGMSYTYEVEGRTLSALDHEASSWSGVNLKAQLTFKAKTANQLIAKFSSIRYAQIHQDLQNWDSILQHNLQYQSYPALERPIEVTMEGGIMRSITVAESMTVPEENMLKGLIGQFQYDTNSKKRIHSRRNYYDGETSRGLYRTMETDVTGKCEVLYSVSQISDNHFNFELPSEYSKAAFTEILKTKNYANCEKRIASHFGLPGKASFDVEGQNTLLDTSTVYRIIAHRNNTIYSTEAITKVTASPLLYYQKAIVVSRVNATLIAIERDDQAKALKGLSNGRHAGSLLYSLSEKEASIDGLQNFSNSNVNITKADQSFIYDHYIRYNKNENLVEEAWKIVQAVVQEQNNFKQDTLEKYDTLMKIITSMSFKQLQTLNQFVHRSDEWHVIRDTVSQCGSIPAFELVKYWLEKRQLKGEEAAEVVSVLASSMRYPTRQVMSDFFDMAMSDNVRKEKYLNSSALLASTRFINKGDAKSDSFIRENVLPALRSELYDALKIKDSERAQAYIKAIGNLGHPDILEIFSPCLEGKIGSSTYLRTEIINSLGILGDQYPHLTRIALFNVYQNSGERYEVRVAAVHQLMRCKPTRTMLQRMAEFTNIDDSNQVRAVVQSAIIYASKLRAEKYKDIAAAAKTAIPSLTTQEFGLTSSFKFLEDLESDQINLDYLYGLNLMGSDDSMLPKGFTQWWLKKQGGWFQKNQMSFTSSSIRNFQHHASFIVKNKVQTNESGDDSKWSAQNISKLLNIEADDTEPLEGNFFFELFNQQRLFAFDRRVLESLPHWFQNQYDELSKGKKYSYSKFFNQNHISIMFPVAMGMTFVLNYESPILIKVDGFMQMEVQPAIFQNGAFQLPKNIDISNKLQGIIYCMNFKGKVGFLNYLDDRLHFAGITSKFQVNLPINTKINLDLQKNTVEIEAEPLDPTEDFNFMHYSVKPYTSSEKKNIPIPTSYGNDYKEVQMSRTPVEINSTYGAKETGMVFKVQGYIQDPAWQRPRYIFNGHNWLTQKETLHTDISMKYDAQRSVNKKLVATLQWGQKSESRTTSTTVKSDPATNSDFHINKPSDISYGSMQRPQEMLNSAASGMIYAKSYFTDIGFRFEGQQKSEYIATLSWATSNVDAKCQAVFYFQKSGLSDPFQVCSIAKILKHNTPELDYKKASEYKVQSNFQTELNFGESCESGAKLSLKGLFKQSPQRQQYLRNDPNVKACQKQMSTGFHQAPVCQYSIFQTNLFDRMQAKIEYDAGLAAENLTFNIYSILRKLGHKYVQGDLVGSITQSGKIEVEAQLTEGLKILYVSIGSADRDVKFSGIPLSRWVAELIAVHPSHSPVTRIFNYATARAYTPTCSIDSGFVTTFSNKTYSYQLGKCWHVAMINEPGQQMSQPQLIVAVRDIGKQQKEAKIYYSNEDGDKLFILLQPSCMPESSASGSKLSGQVYINGKHVQIHEYKAYEEWKKNRNASLIQAYGIPGGEVVIHVDDSSLQVIYDGERIKLFGSESYRNTTRGICGAMSGEDIDDFVSPENCIHREAKYAASLYALVEEECEGPALKWNRLAQNVPCVYRERAFTMLYVSDSSNDKIEEDKSSPTSDEENSYETIADTRINGDLVYESRNYYQFEGKCKVQKQAQAYEKNGEICITLESVPACNPHCRMSKNKPQIVKSVCRSSKDQSFRMYRKQLKEGKNIELDENTYETTARAYYKFALSCY